MAAQIRKGQSAKFAVVPALMYSTHLASNDSEETFGVKLNQINLVMLDIAQ
jgi:hypothetical protein